MGERVTGRATEQLQEEYCIKSKIRLPFIDYSYHISPYLNFGLQHDTVYIT